MATYIKLIDYKSSGKKQRIDTMVYLGAIAFEELVGKLCFVLEKAE